MSYYDYTTNKHHRPRGSVGDWRLGLVIYVRSKGAFERVDQVDPQHRKAHSVPL